MTDEELEQVAPALASAQKLRRRVGELEALVAEMTEALEAFASADINDTARDNQAIDNACAVFITHGDLRTASRLVQKAKAEGSAE